MFDLQQSARDIATFHKIIGNYLNSVPDDAWDKRTGTRDKDWTQHQVLAHLVSIARLFNQALEVALEDRPFYMPGFERREDLRDWNAAQIAALTEHAPQALTEDLLNQLKTAKIYAETVTPQQAEKSVMIRVYNRPSPVRNLIDWQLSHAGIVHAAQVTRPTDTPPLWSQYDADFNRRQIDRFLRHFSWAYWNTLMPDLHATVNFRVEGAGDWQLIAAPDGGDVKQGASDSADYEIRFARPDVMFGVFTVQISLKDALSSGEMTIREDWKAVFNVLKLFNASPPNL